jgi:large subunit ribosomal protein L24
VHVAKNDTVVVIAGDDRGKTGKVLKVFPKTRKIIVEKVNFIIRHTRPTQRVQQGGRVEREAPIDASNVMVYCQKCGKGVKVRRVRLADGRRVRACKSCGEMLSQG